MRAGQREQGLSGHREILPQQHNKRRGKGGMCRRISKACLPGKNLEIAPNMESREAFIRTNLSSFMPYTPRPRGRNATVTQDHETRAPVLPILSPERTEGMDIPQPLGYLVSGMIRRVCHTFSISCMYFPLSTVEKLKSHQHVVCSLFLVDST